MKPKWGERGPNKKERYLQCTYKGQLLKEQHHNAKAGRQLRYIAGEKSMLINIKRAGWQI